MYSILQAINLALKHALKKDNSVLVFGEDVGKNGGVFRATENLQQEFGSQRVFDTPISESLIAGMAVGMTSAGLKPIAEFQFMGFIYPAMEQIICHVARIHNRSMGKINCQLVFRAPFGGGIHAPEHHSESTEALFAHIPGLRVVVPSSPQLAYSLLASSIQSPDPVIFLEPKKIYHAVKDTIDFNKTIALDQCHIIKPGSDLTILTWGAVLHTVKQTIQLLERSQDISIEIIDLSSIKPIDMNTIINSVNKTRRCLIIQEAPQNCGIAAEIAAKVQEKLWSRLVAPVMRLSGYDTIMPLAKLEKYYLASPDDIFNKIKTIMEY